MTDPIWKLKLKTLSTSPLTMHIEDQKLIETLKKRGIKEAQLEIWSEKAKEDGISLYQIIEKVQVMSSQEFAKMTADILGLTFVDLSQAVIPKDVLELVPENFALKFNIISFQKSIEKGEIYIATSDPSQKQIIEDIEKKAHLKAVVYYTTPRQIKDILQQYSTELKKLFLAMIPKKLMEIADQDREISPRRVG